MSPAPPAPVRNEIREFGLILSRFCVAACRHCGSSSGPDQREWIDADLAHRVLGEAADAGVEGVILTGGEPLARFELARSLVARAHDVGLAPRVCSNGYWGNRPARATEWATQLADAGLDLLMLSTDRWHLPFVELDAVVTAANAGTAAGLPVQIAIPAGNRDFTAMRLLTELQQRTDALVYTHPAHPVGKGEELPAQALHWKPPALEGCHLVGHVEVDHDGLVSASPTSADFPRTSPLLVGSAADEPLGDILDRFHRTPLYGLIARWGPLGVHVLLRSDLDIADRELGPLVHDCHLCRDVHRDAAELEDFTARTGLDLLTPADPDRFAATIAAADERILAALAPTPQPVTIGATR